MKIKHILTVLAMVALLVGCGGGDYSPKPKAYLRIDMPEHKYWLVDTLPLNDTITLPDGQQAIAKHEKPYHLFPFIFEANECVELAEKGPRGEVWLDINYPQWGGVVFLTYKHLRNADDLRGQTDTSTRMLEKHYSMASGIEEQSFSNPDANVYAITYRLKGNKVASTYQFWATDRKHHYLRGALFLDRAPNNDSLAPILEYIQEDMDHLVETLRWR